MDDASSRPHDDEVRLVRALLHPLRAQVFQRLAEGQSTPARLARELRASVGVTSYHVRVLRDAGCVELVATVPRRGAIEHHYRAVVPPMIRDRTWERLPVRLRRVLTEGVLREVARDVSGA